LNQKTLFLWAFWFAFALGMVCGAWSRGCAVAQASTDKSDKKDGERVVLTLDEWRKVARDKAERIRRNQDLSAKVRLLERLLQAERSASVERVLAERVRCADLQKAAKCNCPSNGALYACLGVCGVVVVGGVLGGVGVGHAIKACP